jgi:hypothetical protein
MRCGSEADYFDDIPDGKIPKDMLDPCFTHRANDFCTVIAAGRFGSRR